MLIQNQLNMQIISLSLHSTANKDLSKGQNSISETCRMWKLFDTHQRPNKWKIEKLSSKPSRSLCRLSLNQYGQQHVKSIQLQ